VTIAQTFVCAFGGLLLVFNWPINVWKSIVDVKVGSGVGHRRRMSIGSVWANVLGQTKDCFAR